MVLKQKLPTSSKLGILGLTQLTLYSWKACSKRLSFCVLSGPSFDASPIPRGRHAEFIFSFLAGSIHREPCLPDSPVGVRQRSTYRDGRAGRVGPIARGGEGSQWPATSVGPVGKAPVYCYRGTPGKLSIFSQTNDTTQSVRVWTWCSAQDQGKQTLYTRLIFI